MTTGQNLIPLLLNGDKTAPKPDLLRRRRQETNSEIEPIPDEKMPPKRIPFSMEDLSSIALNHPVPCFFALCVLFFMMVEYTLPMIPSNSPPFDLGFEITKPLQRHLASNPNLNSVLAGLNTGFGYPVHCFFALCVLFFMMVEYSLAMIPSNSPPFDLGFEITKPLQRHLASNPNLDSVLAGLNRVFVAMQAMYVLAVLVMEGRGRSTIATVFMFTCRGVLGYTTQLPLPQEFLGSGVDFPVGNVSFFLFYSGHVVAAVIASIDMRRNRRHLMAASFDLMNLLQVLRLLATRGHYTIDLAAGVMAGVLFDHLAGKYETRRLQKP